MLLCAGTAAAVVVCTRGFAVVAGFGVGVTRTFAMMKNHHFHSFLAHLMEKGIRPLPNGGSLSGVKLTVLSYNNAILYLFHRFNFDIFSLRF